MRREWYKEKKRRIKYDFMVKQIIWSKKDTMLTEDEFIGLRWNFAAQWISIIFFLIVN